MNNFQNPILGKAFFQEFIFAPSLPNIWGQSKIPLAFLFSNSSLTSFLEAHPFININNSIYSSGHHPHSDSRICNEFNC